MDRLLARELATEVLDLVDLGPEPRATAPGADPDGREVRVGGEPAASCLPRGARCRRELADNRSRAAAGSRFPRACIPIGFEGDGFAFDNESPRHNVYLAPFRLASRLVTNGEYMEFMRDGGYETPALWLSDGWDCVRANQWNAPLYWEMRDGQWWHYTLDGMRPVRPRSRSVTSATTRPMPLRAGRARGWRPSSNGKLPRGRCRC